MRGVAVRSVLASLFRSGVGTLPLGITLATVPGHDRGLVDLARRAARIQQAAS